MVEISLLSIPFYIFVECFYLYIFIFQRHFCKAYFFYPSIQFVDCLKISLKFATRLYRLLKIRSKAEDN